MNNSVQNKVNSIINRFVNLSSSSNAMTTPWPELASHVLGRDQDERMLAVLGMFGHAGATKIEWNG